MVEQVIPDAGKLVELAGVVFRTLCAAVTMAFALVAARGVILGDLHHPILGSAISVSMIVTSFAALRARAASSDAAKSEGEV